MVILSVPDSNSPEKGSNGCAGAGTGAFGTFMGTGHLKQNRIQVQKFIFLKHVISDDSVDLPLSGCDTGGLTGAGTGAGLEATGTGDGTGAGVGFGAHLSDPTLIDFIRLNQPQSFLFDRNIADDSSSVTPIDQKHT